MGSELLTDSEDSQQNEGSTDSSDSPLLLAKMLDDCFPYYLSIGMTYEQYWDGEPSLVIAYRKAEDIRTHRRNWEMWMQGRYAYDAIYRMIPSLNAWKPKDPLEYVSEPYPLTKKEYEEKLAKEQRKQQEDIRMKMFAFANAHRKKTEEKENAGNN